MGVPATRMREAEEGHRVRIELSWQIYRELARKSLPARPPLKGDPSRQISLELADRFRRLL
jgi:hypothetical protein